MGDILIKNGFIATMDRKGTVYRKGNIYIEDERIVSLGKCIGRPQSPEFVIDAEHKVVLPGFVNVHSHLQQYFRGLYEIIGDFYQVNLPLEMYRSPDDMEWLGISSCLELIYGGCTTTTVTYTYPDGFAKAVEKAGNKVILGSDIEEVDLDMLRKGVYEYLPEKGDAAFKRATNLYRNWHGKAGGRITAIMAPKAADMTRPETYIKCKEFADERELKITTHLSQSKREVEQVKNLFGKTPPEHLNDLGLLDKQFSGAHCTYITERDTQLIKEAGAGILHCRAVTNPLNRWLHIGIPVGLGTDDYFHDMLQLIRQNIMGQRTRKQAVGGIQHTQERPAYYEFLELATRRGAEVLGIDGELGSIEPGKKADLITINLLNPYLTPTKDPLTSIVLYGTSSDIDNVVVDGKFLKKEGLLTNINLKKALLKAQIRVEKIIQSFFEDYPNQREAWYKLVPYMKY